MLVRLRICTIPLTFRRVSVCVCLVGFASLQSLWAHTFKASLPCLPLPLHQILTFPQPLQKDNNPLPRTMFLPPLSKVRCCRPKKFGRLPEGLLPIRTINEIFRTIPSTKLASLVKGRWLDGTTQTFALLLSACDTPAFSIYQTFLPSRRRDCHSTNLSKTALSHPHSVLQSSICVDMLSHLHYPTRFS